MTNNISAYYNENDNHDYNHNHNDNNNENNKLSFIKKIVLFCKNTFGIYLLWILIHFISVQLYVYFCTPFTLYGFLISPFISCAPHCKALNWAIYNSSNIIEYMWVLIGSWICSKLFIDKVIKL